ncbi:phosphatidylserine synthase [Marinomonas sp. TW1]|nr:phosphatidylserine synthase [Marinomonas sp. TW1]
MMPQASLFVSLPAFSVHPDNFNILHSAVEYRKYLLEAIRTAKSRIFLVALYLENDEAGREILTAAYEAKQRSPDLDIVICVDWHRAQRGLIGAEACEGNAAMYQEFAQKYKEQIAIYGVPVRHREVFGVLHLKGFIIDDTVIYSGASLNNVYLHRHDKYRFDRYHVIENQKLADSMVSFIEQVMIGHIAVKDFTKGEWPTTKKLKPLIKQYRMSLSEASYPLESELIDEHHVGITPLVGIGKKDNQLNQCIVEMIAEAKHELYLCTPYFNLPKVVLREVKRAIKRGVKTHIIVGDKVANDFYIPQDQTFKAIGGLPYLYEIILRKFARANRKYLASGDLSIYLWRHEANSFHLKGLWVDRNKALLTGNNVNPRAWALDLENGLLVQDNHQLLEEKFLAEFGNIFDHTKTVSNYLQLDTRRDYPVAIQKLLKRVFRVKADRLLKRIL